MAASLVNIVPMTLPKTLTKAQLCRILSDIDGIPCSPYRLKFIFLGERFITDQLGITWYDYSRIKEFTPAQTEKIVEYLKIRVEDME